MTLLTGMQKKPANMRITWIRPAFRIGFAVGRTVVGLCVLAAGSACSLSDLVNKAAVPADMRHPGKWENEAGALSLYRGARNLLKTIVASTGVQSPVASVAIFTDEMQFAFPVRNFPLFATTPVQIIDARAISEISGSFATIEGVKTSYERLHNIRVQSNLARQYLYRFGQGLPLDLVGHTMAMEAYAIASLAELYCSGFPLSLINFDGEHVLGRTTSQEDALAVALRLVDSSLTQFPDSTRLLNFAKVVRGRILISLGQYQNAAAAVQDIPTNFQYTVSLANDDVKSMFQTSSNGTWSNGTVADREGTNGLDFVSSGDPRTRTVVTATGVRYPTKYKRDGTSPFLIASGVEARLIQAEAMLASGTPGEWLQTLNQLRNNGIARIDIVDGRPPDTVWVQGPGAMLYSESDPAFPGMKNLADPGTDTARVSLMFRERAFWLFLTGNRQIDLRRLIRQYRRVEDQLYPIGSWGPGGMTSYGSDVTLPVPIEERNTNGNYMGCLSRDA